MASSGDGLRASEFAAILNGDNPQAILRVLKQFAKTVRKERRCALSSQSDEDSEESGNGNHDNMSVGTNGSIIDDNGDEDDNHNDDDDPHHEPPTKKYKKSEQWKVDTAAYNVPFVGTAVARGEIAEVKKGEWPTGLVKAYLEKSPLAVELLNEDLRPPNGNLHKNLLKKSRRKLSTSICKAHCLALAELLTVAIPGVKIYEHSLDNDSPANDINQIRFIPDFIKRTLPWIFEILNEDTEKGRGRTGVDGGCGPLVAPALRILQNFSLISTSNARMVARHLDESMSSGVLRLCMRPIHFKKETQDEDVGKTPQKPARAEAIRLGTCLLKANDAATNAYICTSGSKEGKIKPGILYIAFREGISSSDDDGDDFHNAVADMFELARRQLFQGSTTSANSRLLHDLISRDPLQHLTKITSHAPALVSGAGFMAVLDASDVYETKASALATMEIEARRLLFLLLSDTSSSPLLLRHEGIQIAKTLTRLLEFTNDNIELHQFIVFCTVESPFLVGELLPLLNVPDPQRGFEYIARARLISLILGEGPTVADCFFSTRSRVPTVNEMLLLLFPSKFRTQYLAKAFHNGSSIVLMETLKFMICVFARYNHLLSTKLDWPLSFLDERFVREMSSALKSQLPDVRVMLSVLSRLDGRRTFVSILIEYLCQVIEAWVGIFPEFANQFATELMRQLPDNFLEFLSFLPRFQMKYLSCLHSIVKISQLLNAKLLLSSKALFGIMLSTKIRRVHDICCGILVELLSPALMHRGSDHMTERYIKHEASVWIDALSLPTLSFFFTLLEGSLEHKSWPHLVSVGIAWGKCHVTRKMNFSVLLAAALSTYDKSRYSSAFIGQVVTRCILYLSDPLPLAAVVVCSNEVDSHTAADTDHFSPLLEYAKTLTHYVTTNPSNSWKALKRLVDAFYSEDSQYVQVLKALAGADGGILGIPGLDIISRLPNVLDVVKFLNHAFIVGQDKGFNIKAYSCIIRRMLPGLLWGISHWSNMKTMVMPVLEDVISIRNGFEDGSAVFPSSVDFLASLCSFTLSLAPCTFTEVTEGNNKMEMMLSSQDERLKLLYFCFMGRSISVDCRIQTLLSLVSLGAAESSATILEIAHCFCDLNSFEEELKELDDEIWKKLIHCWLLVSYKTKSDNNSLLARSQESLCEMIVKGLNKHKSVLSILLLVLRNHSDREVIGACLDVQTGDLTTIPPGLRLLLILLERDGYYYYNYMTMQLTHMDERLLKLWTLGCLDDIAIECLDQSHTMDGNSGKSWLEVLFPLINKRIFRVLSPDSNTDGLKNASRLFELASRALTCHSGIDYDLSALESSIDRSLVDLHTCHEPGLLMSSSMRSLCGLAARVVLEMDCQGTAVGSHLISFILRHLPIIMKRSISVNNNLSGTFSHDAIIWLLELLDHPTHLYAEDLKQFLPSMIIEKTIRSCLKHGISTSSGLTSSLSLGLVGKLLTWASSSDCPIASSIPSSVNIFDKVTSHSKFQPLFVEQSHTKDMPHLTETRNAVLKLMLDCLCLAPTYIKVTPATWTTIFAPFNAGSEKFDTLILRLCNACSKECTPFLDELRFIDFNNYHSCELNSWEWFLQGMSPARIRATIALFPLEEELDPRDNIVSDGQITTNIDHEKGYSPVLFLGLLLGALESCLAPPKDTCEVMSDNSDRNAMPLLNPPVASSVEMVHRVCEKGAVGICFMSLCSLSKQVRLHAIACLGIIARIAATDQAKELSSWRDRPQLSLILDSVRRGLLRIKSSENDHKATVPRILPIVANFLARAVFVLARPDDPLYEAINRYFLKSDSSHGAFHDFNRLPAFMSLFCSRAINPQQSRAERLWALQNIRDGLLDADSFRVVASCHAPELILTSFENVRLSKLSHESQATEYCVLLEALKAMLDHGGHAAHVYLIRRCGLLAWMNSLCSRELTQFFPSSKTAITFCELIKATMRVMLQSAQVRTVLSVHEVRGLIEPLLMLCLLENGDAIIPSALSALRDVRWLLELLKEDQNTQKSPNTVHAGASLHSTFHVLKLVEGTLRESVLEVLCCLPLSFVPGPSRDDVDAFLLLALQSCENCSVHTKDKNQFMTVVFQRICVLLERSRNVDGPSISTTSTHDVIRRIFSLRSCLNFTHSMTLEELWKKTLELAQELYPQGDEWLRSFLHHR